MRLAWFSPWPPQKSGIAGRSAEVVAALAARGHAIDVMVDAAAVRTEAASGEAPAPGRVRVVSAHDFPWRHARRQYDLAVYQIGNSHLHRFVWPAMFRFPGLVVLHDARVHHARAEALLSRDRDDDYRAEFAWSHPGTPPALAELAILRIEGVHFYVSPMIRGAVESARLVGCHSAGVMTQLAAQWPGRPLAHIALGEGPRDLDIAGASTSFRRRHGLADDAIVFGVFGGLTLEKRVPEILEAFAAAREAVPGARLVLAGSADPDLDLATRIVGCGLGDVVCRVESLDDAEFDRAIAACDVTFNLRWPSSLETSGPWVRSLALGRPTIVVDLAHQTHVPALDPRTWRVHEPAVDPWAGADARAVMVAIDVRDLGPSLVESIRRLGTDAALRARLGTMARAWWEREHTVDRMVDDYEAAMARAVNEPAPCPDWPAHMRPDPAAHTRRILASPEFDAPLIRGRVASVAAEVP